MCVSLIGGLIFSSNPPDTAIFNWVSKIIWDSVFFLYFALLIGPENSRLSLNRSDANQIQSQLGLPRFPAP